MLVGGAAGLGLCTENRSRFSVDMASRETSHTTRSGGQKSSSDKAANSGSWTPGPGRSNGSAGWKGRGRRVGLRTPCVRLFENRLRGDPKGRAIQVRSVTPSGQCGHGTVLLVAALRRAALQYVSMLSPIVYSKILLTGTFAVLRFCLAGLEMNFIASTKQTVSQRRICGYARSACRADLAVQVLCNSHSKNRIFSTATQLASRIEETEHRWA
jgi:hypothetical protein